MKAKQKNLVLFLIIAMILCVCASCGKDYGSVKDVASGMDPWKIKMILLLYIMK